MVFDIYLFQNKKLLEHLHDNPPAGTDYENKFLVANAVIRDVECNVTFTPVFNQGEPPTMTYDAVYQTKAGNYTMEYNKIVYCHNGTVQMKTLDETRSVECHMDSLTHSETDDISNITTGDVVSKVSYLVAEPDTLLTVLNNSVYESSSIHKKELVDIETKFNHKKVGSTW